MMPRSGRCGPAVRIAVSRGPHFAPNRRPARPAAPREAWTRYFAAMQTLAAQMVRVLALALDLPEHDFDDKGGSRPSRSTPGMAFPAS